jgi:hypothetical protein
MPEFIGVELIIIPAESNMSLIMVYSKKFIELSITGKNRIGFTAIQGNSKERALLTGGLYLSTSGLNFRESECGRFAVS